MKSFRDYLEEKQQLDEGIHTDGPIIIPRIIYHISLGSFILSKINPIITPGIKIRNKLRNIWKLFKEGLTDQEFEERIDDISNSPEVKKQMDKIKKVEDKFSKELAEVYYSIEKKDWKSASENFNSLSSSLRNNPDVVSVIINKISEVNGEPPLYTNSPGNSTYQAIKKIINIRTARAAAEATKKALE